MAFKRDYPEIPQALTRLEKVEEPANMEEMIKNALKMGAEPVNSVCLDLRCRDEKIRARLLKGETVLFCTPPGGAPYGAVRAQPHYTPLLWLAAALIREFTKKKIPSFLPYNAETLRMTQTLAVVASGTPAGGFERLYVAHAARQAFRASGKLKPPSLAEAEAAALANGYPSASALTRVAPFGFTDSARAEVVQMKHNVHSGNGPPILGKGDDGPSMQACVALAVRLHRDLLASGDVETKLTELSGVGEDRDLRKVLATDRAAFTFQLKFKTDLYSMEKASKGRGRLIVAAPRPVNILIGRASQAMGSVSSCVPESHNAQGFSLLHGGTEVLVDYLERCGTFDKYTTSGDDSLLFVPINTGGAKYMLQAALDAEAYDLCHLYEVFKPVHQVIARRLRSIDVVAAALFERFMHSRDVLIWGALVARFRDTTPSGLNGFSVVNGVAMTMILRRILSYLRDGDVYYDMRTCGSVDRMKDLFRGLVLEVGAEVGVRFKFEHLEIVAAGGVRESLRKMAVPFVGYHLYAMQQDLNRFQEAPGPILLGLRAFAFADLPRFLKGFRFLGKGQKFTEEQLPAQFAATLAGRFISLGTPPDDWGYSALRELAIASQQALARYAPEKVENVEILHSVFHNETNLAFEDLEGAFKGRWILHQRRMLWEVPLGLPMGPWRPFSDSRALNYRNAKPSPVSTEEEGSQGLVTFVRDRASITFEDRLQAAHARLKLADPKALPYRPLPPVAVAGSRASLGRQPRLLTDAQHRAKLARDAERRAALQQLRAGLGGPSRGDQNSRYINPDEDSFSETEDLSDLQHEHQEVIDRAQEARDRAEEDEFDARNDDDEN